MSKVKCEDCKFWSSSGRKRHARNAMFSLSYDSLWRTVGFCMNDDCARATSGYTGQASGHKMTRLGETERYCEFFELRDDIKKKLQELRLNVKV